MKQLVVKALETNSFTTQSATANYINKTLWHEKILEFAKAKLVVAPLGKVFNELMVNGGSKLNVQISKEIEASTLTENTAITPSAISYEQVVFEPTERGVAVAITRKERVRAMQDVLAEKTRDMGYALAKLKDKIALTALASGAGFTLYPNGKTSPSALTTTDTINVSLIVDAIAKIRGADFNAKYLIIHPDVEASLIKLNSNGYYFIDASVYGGREVVLNGEIGKFAGLKVLTTTNVPKNSTNQDAYECIVMDDEAFGIAMKMQPTFDVDYKVLDREFVLASVEDYDIKVLYDKKVAKLIVHKGY